MPAEPSERRLNRRRSTRREEDYKVETGHSRELELKRSRGEVSCAECRRLKIKCSRNIPCENCCKRGCSQLCPNGSLATGQGTRFVLAATEHLHRKIARYGARIRELEDALAQLQLKNSDEPHPLLQQHLQIGNDDSNLVDGPSDSIPPSLDVADALGTLTINEQGISRFFGPTGGSESLLARDLPFEPSSPPSHASSSPSFSGRNSQSPLSAHPLFSQTFPLTPLGQPSEIRSCIESNLPTYDRAVELCNIYFDQVGWVFKGVRRAQVFEELLPNIYGHNTKRPMPEEEVEHTLALAFTMFAIAASVEPVPPTSKQDGEEGRQSTLGEHYHQLARAALSLRPILEKPSLITIQTLHLLGVFSGMGNNSDTQTGVEMLWSLGALACHLAQTIGLHRDAARWGLPTEEVQRRRFVFYDLFVGDMWGALCTGRPPTFSLIYIDCPYPQYEVLAPEDLPDAQMELWLFRFTVDIVSEVAAKTLTPAPPSYQTVLELDKKVRDYPLLDKMDLQLRVTADVHSTASESSRQTIQSFQQCIMEHMKETILLYIHRGYFAQSLIENPQNPLKSTYSSSFLAAYRSASTILKSVNAQFALAPRAVSVIPMMLVYVFSAAIVFGTIVTRGPTSPLASGAMSELETACLLFSKASVYSSRAKKALLILLRLREKAHVARMSAKKPSSADQIKPTSNDGDDELTIFAGRTRFTSYARTDPMNPGFHRVHSQSSDLHGHSPQHGPTPPALRPLPSHGPLSQRPSLEGLHYAAMAASVPPGPSSSTLHPIVVPQPTVRQHTFIDDHTQTYSAHPDHFPQTYQPLAYGGTPANSSQHYVGQLPPVHYNESEQQRRYQPVSQHGDQGYYDTSQQFAGQPGWGQQSGLEQRWGSFMQDSGIYDDNGYRPY